MLRTWNQRTLSSNVNDAGRKMLVYDAEKDRDRGLDDAMMGGEPGGETGYVWNFNFILLNQQLPINSSSFKLKLEPFIGNC